MTTKTATKDDVQMLMDALAATTKYASAMPQSPASKEGTLAVVAASQRIFDAQAPGAIRARTTWILNGVKFAPAVRGAVAASSDPDATADDILSHALNSVGINV